ncbi:MAG TPA: SCP2 sterol-binding domain-containing protein [Steroidobacteraceae bacterium]|nr:SCP2 sterol-binding domain-containing protein [Steroidobacteraceae bacterium]
MLTSTLEALLNRGLPRSPRARELVSELSGRTLAIEAVGIGAWALSSDGNGIHLRRERVANADVRLSGGPLSLLRLLAAASAVDPPSGLSLHGDTHLADRFRELLRLLQPDLEEELALAIGDVPAHELARLARGTLGWLSRAADTTLRNLAEYLAHERGDLVSRAEGRQLLGGVDVLRDHVDRLAAQAELLAQRIEAGRRSA